MLIEATTLIAIFAVILYIYLTWNYNYWRKQGIVQVEPVLPGFGNILQSALLKRSASIIHNDIYRKFQGHPVVGFFHLRQPALIVRDPDIIQTVLVNSFSKFHANTIQISENNEPILSIDPFFSVSSKWKENRTAMAPAFTNSRVKSLFPKMQELCGQLNQYLDKHLDNDFEVATLTHLYTTNVVSSCVFGLTTNTASGEENILMKYGKIMTQSWSDGALSGFAMFILFFMPTFAKVLKIRFVPSKVNDFVQEMVNMVIDYREKNNVTQNDYLQMIVKNREKALSEAKPDDKAAQEQSNTKMFGLALTFFMEGFETSSMTLNYTLYELAMNANCQKKLREELQEATKEGKLLEYETLMRLPYLDHVVSEGLRKYPSLHSMMKTCTESTTLQIQGKSVHVKAGTHIVVPVHALHNDPKWYPNPEKFDPDRFSEENNHNRHHYAYLPFGEGPRMCVGMRFAMAQIKAFLANTVLNYNIVKCDRTPEQLTFNPIAFMMETNEHLWIRLQKRERHTG